jgi:peptide/nickel transport system permease protein
MTRYIAWRLVQALPTLFGITLISYLLILLAPGDPLAFLTFNPGADPAATERMRRQLGLDQPPLTQYLYYMIGNDWVQIDVNGDGTGDIYGSRQGLLRGDLGVSIQRKRPVLDLILERIPATLRLTLTALLIGYGVGIALGMLAAVTQGSWVDQLIRFFSVFGTALPNFWLGLIVIIIFSVNLGWLPIGGMRDLTRSSQSFDLWDSVRHMILPVSILALGIIATVSRYMRASALEVISADYVRTARAKGMQQRRVLGFHVMRNALIPIATLVGPALSSLIGGSVIIEQVFSWPGMGRLTINAIFQRDLPLIMGTVLISAVLYIIGLLISDILYALLDPRIRF